MTPKVILVTGSVPPDACGIGDYTVALASALEKAGQHVEVLCHREWSVAGTSQALRKLLTAGDALVHMQYPTLGYGYSLGPQISLLIKRSIVTIHEFSLAHPLRKLSLLPFTLRSPSLVMTSEFERRVIVQKMPWISSRVRVIPIGSNIHPYRIHPKEREESVAYFGLVTPGKGIEDFIEFARLVRARNLDWELLIIGKIVPRHEAYAKSLMDILALYRVRLILDRSAEEVSELLARTGLAYLPFPDGASERRGSLKAVLAAGLPCITTCGEQTPRELAKSVMLAAAPHQAADAAVHLMATKDAKARLSERAYEYSRQFAWEQIAELHLRMYRELDVAL